MQLFGRVLGYGIEALEHAALWGKDRHWQAVSFDGRVLRHRLTRRAIFETQAGAITRAQEHAREVMPKLLASERWVDWSWSGGEEYREWLITLPLFPGSFLSDHFDARNVLAHVRRDLREGADGERVLMLHELQSDWMQSARRDMREHENGADGRGIAHVIPKRHVVSFFDVTGDERKSMLALLDSAKLGLDAAFHPDGYNIGINDGVAAGQTVPHLHLHLIPRYAGDREDARGGVRWVLPHKAKHWP